MPIATRRMVGVRERTYHHRNWTSRRRPPNRPRRVVRRPDPHSSWTNFSGPVRQTERTASTTSGITTSILNGLQGLASQKVGAGTPIYFTRTPDGQLISLRQGAGGTSTNSYYLTDPQGSVLALTNAAGTTDTASYSYDPYGQTLTATGTLATTNPYRYATAYYDSTSGLDKLGERYYNAAFGRFVQPDPAGLSTGGYIYAANNPAVFTDATGESIFGDISSAFSDVAGGLESLGGDVARIGESAAKGISKLIEIQSYANIAVDLAEGHYREAIAEGAGLAASYLAEAGCNLAADAVTAGAADISGAGETACALAAGGAGEAIKRAAE